MGKKQEIYTEKLAKQDPTAKQRAEIIQKAMMENNLKANDVAKRAGISFQFFLAFMTGKTNVSDEVLGKLSKILKVEPSTIMTNPLFNINDVRENISDNIRKSAEQLNIPNSKTDEKDIEETNNEKEIQEEEIIISDKENINNKNEENESDIQTPKTEEIEKTEEEIKEKVEEQCAISQMEKCKIPTKKEFLALFQLMSDHGKIKAYNTIWEILQKEENRNVYSL